MDLRDYYDNHWSHHPEGGVDYSRLRYVLDALEPGERVLDSGCGPGFLAALLAENGIEVVGTDVSAVGPERTRARGIEARQIDLDTEPLPFADADTPLGNVKDGGVLKTWNGARMRMMRQWHATGNFCAHPCVDCTEWLWWMPQVFSGGGTGGNTTKVKTEESEAAEQSNGFKPLPVVNGSSGGDGYASCESDR